MAEIGAQLREARTRARIEIAQMEAQTKIRAKYLRALETEEWELLPGPTYVKSFLKTYGDMLGIDGRQLVTDYKNTHEPFQAEGDIGQISKHTGGRMNRRQQQASAGLGRLIAAAVLLIAIVGGGGYYLVGRDSGDGARAAQATPAPDAVDGDAVADDPGRTPGTSARKNVSVVVAATTGGVTVCVRAGKRIAVPATELRAGQKTAAVRGRSVVVTADTRAIKLTVGGKRAVLPNGTGPITVTVTDAGVKKASAAATACRA
ncbi:MAG: helix-turn-helix domain-containing protein [Solirubrobacteraceae bacterium]|nr:helix-turn-helix domain-containing protein [Solirubrobacteraceae bacterium]